MSSTINSIRGMHDTLPQDMHLWHRLEDSVRSVFSSYGFEEIRIPVVEKTEVFARAIGDATDVVEKEMYTFEDRNGDLLSLRPEGTAGVVRAVLQNGLLYAAPLRLWYMGQMFRRERPQKGRTRQFHQVGVEVFGSKGPDIDAELLAMCQRIWNTVGLSGLRLEVNSLGTSQERSRYRDQLHEFLSDNRASLDADSLRRLDRNPLRILDSKNPQVQEMLADAPVLSEYLGDESSDYFDGFLGLLDGFGVDYQVNPRLVRGLDYYCHAVFEWITDDLGAQGTVCAGGRYDGLVEIQGGKPWPGVGFAMGQERLIELMRLNAEPEAETPHVYLVMAGEGAVPGGMQLAERLRDDVSGLRIQSNLGGGSFKAQFKRADRSRAALAIVLGEDELANSVATIKHLREHKPQEQVAFDDLGKWFDHWLQIN
ncbi:MAG: histidine--tRNA ligase [Xanthomonadales bacterium]|nr:histidine--tRNA ligase [Gammaproteobacteria bacterium]MBT8056821.1 histidine--tRNA ligase [Gammaproteobacteria bacterium]NNL05609.1 histidine--tRNA ligase [Xanthomonadales bacterium]